MQKHMETLPKMRRKRGSRLLTSLHSDRKINKNKKKKTSTNPLSPLPCKEVHRPPVPPPFLIRDSSCACARLPNSFHPSLPPIHPS